MDINLDLLKPSLRKINWAIILFVVFGYLLWPLITGVIGGDGISFGFPMTIREANFAAVEAAADGEFEPFSRVAVFVDGIFWYLVAIFATGWWDGRAAEDQAGAL